MIYQTLNSLEMNVDIVSTAIITRVARTMNIPKIEKLYIYYRLIKY